MKSYPYLIAFILAFYSCMNAVAKEESISKKIGLSSWKTIVSYDEVTVKDTKGNIIFHDDFSEDKGDWEIPFGWEIRDGKLLCTNELQEGLICACKVPVGELYTLEVKASKLGGAEGFLIAYDIDDFCNYSWVNYGGWNNTAHSIQHQELFRQWEEKRVKGNIESNTVYNLRVVVNKKDAACFLNGQEITTTIRRPPVVTLLKPSKLSPEKEKQAQQYYDMGTQAKDPNEIFKNYEKAAQMGLPAGYRALGMCYNSGVGVSKNASKAHELYLKGAEGGDRLAMVCWANYYVEYRESEAYYWYLEAAKRGSAWGYYALAHKYWVGGQYRSGQNNSIAGLLYIEAAKRGTKDVWEAIYNKGVGPIYHRDYSWKEYLAKASPDAQYAVDYCEAHLNPTLQHPYEKSLEKGHPLAFKSIEDVAEKGNSWAMGRMSHMLWMGDDKHVKQDKARAVTMSQNNCKNSDNQESRDVLIAAKCEGLYSGQIPVEWNKGHHAGFVREKANQGHLEAMFAMGCDNGIGNKERVEWLMKCVNQEHQPSLDVLYEMAKGSSIEAKKAYGLYMHKKDKTSPEIYQMLFDTDDDDNIVLVAWDLNHGKNVGISEKSLASKLSLVADRTKNKDCKSMALVQMMNIADRGDSTAIRLCSQWCHKADDFFFPYLLKKGKMDNNEYDYRQIGDIYKAAQKYNEALEWYEKVKLTLRRSWDWKNIADCHETLGHKEAAEKAHVFYLEERKIESEIEGRKAEEKEYLKRIKEEEERRRQLENYLDELEDYLDELEDIYEYSFP
ncbi:MAG: sel1 repeat family protein [Bacteroidaceae bacterium]|nr:sel1 repeat family protein [Bacteroidaceae bacterium]